MAKKWMTKQGIYLFNIGFTSNMQSLQTHAILKMLSTICFLFPFRFLQIQQHYGNETYFASRYVHFWRPDNDKQQ